MRKDHKVYLERYLSTLPKAQREKPRQLSAFHFCDNEQDANLCAHLAKVGQKRATASLEWCFTHGDEPYPEVGELAVITNWQHNPQCIIEIDSVEVRPYHEVDEAFAKEEGEGDMSLEFWRRVHWPFFCNECQQLGLEPSEAMPIVLQRFSVVYS